MSNVTTDWVDGWEIHYRDDGGYAVYDEHGMMAGPFGTRAEAIQAAMMLPKHITPRQREAGPHHDRG